MIFVSDVFVRFHSTTRVGPTADIRTAAKVAADAQKIGHFLHSAFQPHSSEIGHSQHRHDIVFETFAEFDEFSNKAASRAQIVPRVSRSRLRPIRIHPNRFLPVISLTSDGQRQ